MIQNHFIIIPTNYIKNPICDVINQTASILTKNNNTVLIFYTNKTLHRKIGWQIILNKKLFLSKNKTINYYPINFLPFNQFQLIRDINSLINLLIIKTYSCKYQKKILWLIYPHLANLIPIFKNQYQIVYDIVDFHTLSDSKKNSDLNIKKKKAMKLADVVTSISHTLKSQYQKIYPKKINIVPQGFVSYQDKYQINNLNSKLPSSKKIGFIGALDDRLNYPLLIKLAKNNPQFNFIFIGPKYKHKNLSTNSITSEVNKLLSFKNVFWIKKQPKKIIGSYINNFDVCIIPYDIKFQFNKYCYPMKLFEYFYAGKPVISTPIIELKRFPKYVKISNSYSGWQTYLNQLLNNPWPQQFSQEEKSLALENSWQNKIEKISSQIQKLR